MKVSTILRRACEWSGRNPNYSWTEALSLANYSKWRRDAFEFVMRSGLDGDFYSDPTARSIMLGFAAAIAESEGL